MSLSLGMAASVAASHQNEFSPAHQSTSPMYSDVSMANPLHYFQSRLQAWSSFGAKAPQLPTTVESTNASTTDLNESEHVGDDGEKVSLEQSLENTPTAPKPKIPKTKTSYHLAYPPPITKHKQRFKVRPKVLLQLQRISETQRPRPTYDVLPATAFARGLGKRCGRTLSGRTGLAPDDLVVARSQLYSKDKKEGEEESSEGEDWDEREVLAAICQPKVSKKDSLGHMEIIMSKGPLWLATRMSNGYEFVSVDETGLKTTARWIPAKPKGVGRRDSVDRKKLKFSILTRECRRHPIIAYMERGSINIADKYMIPETPMASPALDSVLTASTCRSSQSSYFAGNDCLEKQQGFIETDEDLRLLIITTGIWVAFCEGWSQNFSYNQDAATSKTSNSTNSSLKTRTTSSRLDVGNNENYRVPTPQSFASARSHQARLNILHRSTASAGLNSPLTSPGLNGTSKIGMAPKRANSLSMALRLRSAQDPKSAERASLPLPNSVENINLSRHGSLVSSTRNRHRPRSLTSAHRLSGPITPFEPRPSEDSTLINTTGERTLPHSPATTFDEASAAPSQTDGVEGEKKSFFGRRDSLQNALTRKPSTLSKVKGLFSRKRRESGIE